jgi:hypothetical protein
MTDRERRLIRKRNQSNADVAYLLQEIDRLEKQLRQQHDDFLGSQRKSDVELRKQKRLVSKNKKLLSKADKS